MFSFLSRLLPFAVTPPLNQSLTFVRCVRATDFHPINVLSFLWRRCNVPGGSCVSSFIAVLHLFEGRNLGVFEMLIFAIGIYASWEDVIDRKTYVTIFALGCLNFAILDFVYLLLVIAASSQPLHNFLVGLVVSNTFPNLSTSLDAFLDALAKDITFFVILSAAASLLFRVMAAYWAAVLHYDVIQAHAHSDIHLPITRTSQSIPRTGLAGFGSLSRQTHSSQPSPRTVNPFTGRGHRLGFGDA